MSSTMNPNNKNEFTSSISKNLSHFQQVVDQGLAVSCEGRLTRLVGLTLEAVGCQLAVGTRCLVKDKSGLSIEAEVVGFAHDKTYLMCTEQIDGLSPGARIIPSSQTADMGVSNDYLGRVVDATAKPLDGKGPINCTTYYPLISKPINPLSRSMISQPLDVGIRSINSLLTVGKGQRLGLFAGSGVGKSVLLGMMTRYTEADIVVVGLIGERGREVKEFIENSLGEQGMARAVVVAAPADQPPLMRLQGALLATTLAEYYRDQGANVLLLMDSLTRYAQAQREIALAIGEPPATKGYPPSVFAKLPQLVERAGCGGPGQGTITAFYTVLTEGDDQQDPIADSARAILDGHFVLSRSLAEAGHYPAIDLEASISRVMPSITNDVQQQAIQQFRHYYSLYQQNSDLINIGAYASGSNPEIDKAIILHASFTSFLKQDSSSKVSLNDSSQQLFQLFEQQQQAIVQA